jgi:hypothetical protein
MTCMVSLGCTVNRGRASFSIFHWFYNTKNVFLAVYASSYLLNNVNRSFLSFLLITVKYNCALIKVDWLAACMALRVVGAVLVIVLRRWRKICTILRQWEARIHTWRNVPKPCWPIRSKETWTGPVPFLGLEVTMHFPKSQIYLVRQSLQKGLGGLFEHYFSVFIHQIKVR